MRNFKKSFKILFLAICVMLTAFIVSGCTAENNNQNSSSKADITSNNISQPTESIVIEGPHASPGYIVEEYILSYCKNDAAAALACFPESMQSDKLISFGASSIEELNKKWKNRKAYTPEINFGEIIDSYKSDSKYFGKPIKQVFNIPDYVDSVAQNYAILTAYTGSDAANYLCAKIDYKWYVIDFTTIN